LRLPCLALYDLARQRAASGLTNKPKIMSARELKMPHIPMAAAHIPILKGAVILALDWHTGLHFDAIAIKIHINGGNNTLSA